MESAHTSALEAKHAGLERMIQQELTRPSPNDVLLQDLKRRKLRVKDAIAHN